MADKASRKTKDTSSRIMEHLAESVNAQDTMEGIVGWWLLQEERTRQARLLKEVELLQKSLLLESEAEIARNVI